MRANSPFHPLNSLQPCSKGGERTEGLKKRIPANSNCGRAKCEFGNTRNNLAWVGIVTCFLVCIPQGHTEPEITRTIDIVTDSSGKVVKTDFSAFNGSQTEIRWLVRDRGDSPLRLTVDVFQIISTAVATIEREQELLSSPPPIKGTLLEARKTIALPESDRPIRQLVKLWIERNGKRTALSLITIEGTPGGLLTPLKDQDLTIAGMSPETAWVQTLKRAGMKIRSIDLPSGKAPLQQWSGPLIAKFPGNMGPVELQPNQKMMMLTDRPPVSGRHLIESHATDTGYLLTFPNELMQSFETDPDIQRRIVAFLTNDTQDIKKNFLNQTIQK
jgi:hypothetical protein